MKISIAITLLLLINIITGNENTKNEDELYKKAIDLSQKFIIIDTHIDVPYRIINRWEDISQKTKSGHFDYVRAKKGGLNAAFMSIYIPSSNEGTGKAKPLAVSLINAVEKFQNNWPDKFAVAVSTEDIKTQFDKGLISLPMGMENGSPIEGDLSNIKYFYNRGIRYITLCHSKDNHICDSSYDTSRTWRGLSPFGKKVVEEMNRLGIMVDVSHVSDDAFYDVIKTSKVPVIASHSSCRVFTPGFERNMSDEMIKAIAKNGGIIQITFGTEFLSGEYRSRIRPAKKYLKENKISEWSSIGESYLNNFIKENNIPISSAKDIANHIDHVVKLVGINFVGLGSDFDGVNFLPSDVQDVSYYPNIIFELLKLGYSDDDIQKICSENFLRVWKQNEIAAKILK